eukprot:scaffold82833_cov60-Phaeocystis_antarctica.AAC.1
MEHLVEGRGRGEIGRDVDLDKVRRELSIEQDVEAEDLEARVAPSEALAVARADVRLCGDERLQADAMDLRKGTVRMLQVTSDLLADLGHVHTLRRQRAPQRSKGPLAAFRVGLVRVKGEGEG